MEIIKSGNNEKLISLSGVHPFDLKIMFIDHDGVMATENDFCIKRNNKFGYEPFSRGCVSVLNEILVVTGADIVVSSDWRNNFTLDAMRAWYAMNGICKLPIGYTPNSKKYNGMDLEGGRSEEILSWVDMHGISKWAAVDDLNMSEFLGDRFVHCPKFREGIRQHGIKEKIISIFGGK